MLFYVCCERGAVRCLCVLVFRLASRRHPGGRLAKMCVGDLGASESSKDHGECKKARQLSDVVRWLTFRRVATWTKPGERDTEKT
eukprot:2831673-Prymnesium_polylepis.1